MAWIFKPRAHTVAHLVAILVLTTPVAVVARGRPMAHESSERMSTVGYVGLWVGLVVLTMATYVLGRHLPLGPFSLPTAEVLEPKRPARSRTGPRDLTPPPPHRMPGD